MDEASRHGELFRDYLINLDVAGMRRLWAAVSPHLPQPDTDDDVLTTMHAARVQMKLLPDALKDYSAAWLKERRIGRIVSTVGISVLAPERRAKQAANIREAMSDAVQNSVKAGLDLDVDAREVKRRMMVARERA